MKAPALSGKIITQACTRHGSAPRVSATGAERQNLAKFNLIIIHFPGRQHLSDFTTIREILGRHAPDIEVHILSKGIPIPLAFWRKAAERPTVLFSPMPIPIPSRVRGLRLIAKKVTKFSEARMLEEAGFPVPFTQMIMPGTVLDERQWGPFAVVKPNMSYRGQGVRLQRTRDVRWIDTNLLPADDPRHDQNLIAQQFIDTGPHALCYRVMTVMAEPVYSVTSTAIDAVPPLSTLPNVPIEIEIAANGVPRRVELSSDREVIDMAKSIHRKLTHTPVMGVDIIREHRTGRLVVLELNSGGWTWHLSSDHGRHQQHDHGLDYYGQFNALEVIAKALAKATHRHAV